MPPPRPWQAPSVKLLEPGAEPRATLRYKLEKGATGHAELKGSGVWRITQTSTPSGGPLPELSTPFDVTVQSPQSWTFKFARATATGPDVDADPTSAIAARLEGVSGTVTTDDRGLASKLSVRPSPLDG